ncbi:hypothetical protein [Pseudomonas sp. DSP3-2-2]|uniref:hypothetical protein n=1 Tax=unclassified Pseudomonas TaxID=196821 RepID=UPI003CF9D12A
MSIESNSVLLQSLIAQLSIVDFSSSLALLGNAEDNLLGLRDLFELEMITGNFIYGALSDPLGLLFLSADQILLTKRGALFALR